VLGVVGISERADPVWFRWDLRLWAPWFGVGAILFGVAATNYRDRTGNEHRGVATVSEKP